MPSAYDKLQGKAEAVISDIKGDMSADGRDLSEFDFGYDLWIEPLRNDEGTQVQVGVVDIGEMYQGVFVWDGLNWDDDNSWGVPSDVIDRIIKARGNPHRRIR